MFHTFSTSDKVETGLKLDAPDFLYHFLNSGFSAQLQIPSHILKFCLGAYTIYIVERS